MRVLQSRPGALALLRSIDAVLHTIVTSVSFLNMLVAMSESESESESATATAYGAETERKWAHPLHPMCVGSGSPLHPMCIGSGSHVGDAKFSSSPIPVSMLGCTPPRSL